MMRAATDVFLGRTRAPIDGRSFYMLSRRGMAGGEPRSGMVATYMREQDQAESRRIKDFLSRYMTGRLGRSLTDQQLELKTAQSSG
jgi:hypothetical protein